MIIWINGAFGSGKTQTSYELHRRIPGSFVYDPENAGYFIRKNIPKSTTKADFQHYIMWREFNYSMLKYIYQEYDGIIIVPMTIVDPAIFNEIATKLRDDGVILHHFTLWASKDILLKRLRSRGERATGWPAQQIDRCMEGLSDDIFQQRIHTDEMSIEKVVTTIASELNLDLLPDQKGKLGKRFDRIKTQLKHIRFFN